MIDRVQHCQAPNLARATAAAIIGWAIGCGGALAQPAPFVPARDPQVVAFSPSGALVATGVSGLSDGLFPPRPHPDVRKCGVVYLWDAASGKRLRRLETFGDLRQLQFSPDGSLLALSRLFATSDGVMLNEVRVWNAVSGQLVRVLDRCHAFAFAPDSKSLAVASRTKCAVFDIATWQREEVFEPLGGTTCVAFAGDALLGVVKTDRGFVLRRCALDDKRLLQESQPLAQPIYTLALSPGGEWLATGHEGQIVLWNPTRLEPQYPLPTKERGWAHPFFSSDKALVAAGCQANGDVVMWDLATRQEVRRYTLEKGKFRPFLSRGEDEVVRPEIDPQRFAFSPDGQAYLSGAYGGILRRNSDGRDVQRFGE